jgi:DNA-binding Lrp family transcriptional regulator
VLIQTEVGKAGQVAQAIRGIDGVRRAEVVAGLYDLIARAQAPSIDELGRLVVARIQGR